MKTIEERFWEKVDKTGDCWEWTAGKSHGYGRFCPSGKTYGAHRYVWELTYGPIPSNMHVCHHCDNPGCVNPTHLFISDHTGNVRDMVAKSRHANGSGITQAKLYENDIPRIRDMLRCGGKQPEIGAWFGVHRASISKINRNETWRHV